MVLHEENITFKIFSVCLELILISIIYLFAILHRLRFLNFAKKLETKANDIHYIYI